MFPVRCWRCFELHPTGIWSASQSLHHLFCGLFFFWCFLSGFDEVQRQRRHQLWLLPCLCSMCAPQRSTPRSWAHHHGDRLNDRTREPGCNGENCQLCCKTPPRAPRLRHTVLPCKTHVWSFVSVCFCQSVGGLKKGWCCAPRLKQSAERAELVCVCVAASAGRHTIWLSPSGFFFFPFSCGPDASDSGVNFESLFLGCLTKPRVRSSSQEFLI